MGPERLPGYGHGRDHEDEESDDLHLGGEPVDRCVPVPVEEVGVGCPAQTEAVFLFLSTAKTPTMPAPTPNVTSTPTTPAKRVPVCSSSTALTS